MTNAKTTQKEAPKAAGNMPAAGASAGGNTDKTVNVTSDVEHEAPQPTEVVETASAAKAITPTETAIPKTEMVPVLTLCKDVVIVVCGTAEALPLLKKAWEKKAAPAVILPREVGDTPFSELITGLMAEEEIPDTFILVPENCFPTATVTIADLTAYRVRKFDDGHKAHDTRLPVLLEAAAVLKTLEFFNDPTDFTAEEFFTNYNSVAHPGELAEEIGMSFGNTVAYAYRPAPCMVKVAEALLRKKFICTTAEGFTPIKERLALLYGGK